MAPAITAHTGITAITVLMAMAPRTDMVVITVIRSSGLEASPTTTTMADIATTTMATVFSCPIFHPAAITFMALPALMDLWAAAARITRSKASITPAAVAWQGHHMAHNRTPTGLAPPPPAPATGHREREVPGNTRKLWVRLRKRQPDAGQSVDFHDPKACMPSVAPSIVKT